MRQEIHASTLVALTIDDEVLYVTLGGFFLANEAGVDETEKAIIIATLQDAREYHGGGGAAAEWTLAFHSRGAERLSMDVLKGMADGADANLARIATAEFARRGTAIKALLGAIGR